VIESLRPGTKYVVGPDGSPLTIANLPTPDGSSGQHDNYGSALTAQPGRSQGRPATNTSSRLIVRIGLPTDVLPVPLVPDGRTPLASIE
jgi:hypothetical protein